MNFDCFWLQLMVDGESGQIGMTVTPSARVSEYGPVTVQVQPMAEGTAGQVLHWRRRTVREDYVQVNYNNNINTSSVRPTMN